MRVSLPQGAVGQNQEAQGRTVDISQGQARGSVGGCDWGREKGMEKDKVTVPEKQDKLCPVCSLGKRGEKYCGSWHLALVSPSTYFHCLYCFLSLSLPTLGCGPAPFAKL